MDASLRIMVVDDTITYRMIMKSVAEGIPGVQVVASASNGRVALDRLPLDQPEVVLLDVEMPVLDGLETLKYLHKNHPEVTVVMVSGLSRSNANLVMECLQAGALDFVTKPLESNATRAREALRRDLEPILTLLLQKKERPGQSANPPTAGVSVAATTTRGVPAPAATRTPPDNLKSGTPAPAPRRTTPVPTPSPAPAPMVTTPPPTRRPAPPRPAAATTKRSAGTRPDLLLIGSSTGGPAALTQLLSDIGQKLSIPALIVQHMPPVFTASLAAQLSRTSGMDVQEAQAGLPVIPGRVVLAMGGVHMIVNSNGQQLEVAFHDGPKVNECRPAVDVLFQSVAEQFTGNVLAIILTGMGRDGAQGVERLKQQKQTWCISQHRESCVVYGMPRAVEEMGLADEVLPLDRIGPRILDLCR
ncbi:MAG: chemotaxis-specific protein-glutamate methyltransferase CheB [Magnetococcales bacterium]|nr:chemotaxis-specific protein-glutamate methyltransferase CheB [Magnetococcales bacterium]